MSMILVFPDAVIHQILTPIVALAIAVGGVLATRTYDAFIKPPIEEYWKERRSRQVREKNKGYYKYFTVQEALTMDTLVYALGLRPDLPCIDALYLEFARHLLAQDRAKELLLVYSRDLSAPEQDAAAFTRMSANVRRVFGNLASRITIIDTDALLLKHASSLFSREFFAVLSFMESDKFLRIASELTGTRVRSVLDFSRHHPLAKRGMSVYVHIVRNWLVRRHLEEQGALGKHSNIVGFLIWETEADKLGVLYQLADEARIKIIPILGRSIYSGRGRPVPVFEHARTLNVFANRQDQVAVLMKAPADELKAYAEILRTIAKERVPENEFPAIAMRKAGRSSLAGGQLATNAQSLTQPREGVYEVVGLLDQLSAVYA